MRSEEGAARRTSGAEGRANAVWSDGSTECGIKTKHWDEALGGGEVYGYLLLEYESTKESMQSGMQGRVCNVVFDIDDVHR